MKPPSPFYVDQRVRLTVTAMHAFIHHNATKPLFGTVRGGSHRWDCVRVQPDGLKEIATYHRTFWESIDSVDVSLDCAAL